MSESKKPAGLKPDAAEEAGCQKWETMGWDDASMVDLLLEFVKFVDMLADLDEFLNHQADIENGDA